jgi:hypothetical protein
VARDDDDPSSRARGGSATPVDSNTCSIISNGHRPDQRKRFLWATAGLRARAREPERHESSAAQHQPGAPVDELPHRVQVAGVGGGLGHQVQRGSGSCRGLERGRLVEQTLRVTGASAGTACPPDPVALTGPTTEGDARASHRPGLPPARRPPPDGERAVSAPVVTPRS